jgi:hypothetical protein
MRRGVALAVLAVLLAGAVAVPEGYAVVHPPVVVDGPANDILEVDGAAIAPDGTGGVVYRKQGVDGVAHVFVVQFVGGRWLGPVQVDTADRYGASMPAIAAGDGGRLLVVWVQNRNTSLNGVTLYALMSASLQPGASSFGEAAPVDQNVGEPYNGDISAVDPSLAMTPASGRAYVVYRVITNDCLGFTGDPLSSLCPPGKLVDVRVARFEYLRWKSLGVVNRAPQQVAMRDPTASNAPSIGIDLNGNGVVAWQEPDSGGMARIWVRRLFGDVKGNVLQASPETIGGRPVTSDAEAPVVAVSPFGEARVAFRVAGAPGSAVAATRLFVNSIPSSFAPDGSRLKGAVAVAGAGGPGVPSVGIDKRGDFRVSWTAGPSVQELVGGLNAMGSPVAVGAAAGSVAPTTVNPAGGGSTAWQASVDGLPAVDVREEYARGAFQFSQWGGPIPGPVSGLSLGGSGEGDALLGWMAGPPGDSGVVGDFVQAPPASFDVSVPTGWVRGRDAAVSWEASSDAVAGIAYTVYLDGKPRIGGLRGLSARLDPVALGDGVHHVQVLASDASGQQTMSSEAELKIDANPPLVRLGYLDRRRAVRVTISDRASGVDRRVIAISFGDGKRSYRHTSAVHVYRRAGVYTITARVRDKAGNQAVDHLQARVR